MLYQESETSKCVVSCYGITHAHTNTKPLGGALYHSCIRFEFAIVSHQRRLSSPSAFPKWRRPSPRNKLQTGSRPGRRLLVLNSQKKRLPEDHPSYYQQNSGKMSASKAKLAHAGSHVSSARELRQLVAASQKKNFLRVWHRNVSTTRCRRRRHWRFVATEAVKLNCQEVA